VQLQQFIYDKYNRNIALLTYNDSIEFKDITILSPPMKVLDYNSKNSTLYLDVSEHIMFQLKLYTFYEYLTNLLFMHQNVFFNETPFSRRDFPVGNLSYEMIRKCFYTILTKSILSLYVHPNTLLKSSEKNNTGVLISDVKPGDMVRCIIRIQGISQLIGKKGMRLRLHHYVPCIWKV
jgi:hypothetical protein